MRKQCARPGCSAPATVTFTFDSRACSVWLDPVSDAGARAGDLCERHAHRLAPPRGWELVDRRDAPPREPAAVAPAPVASVPARARAARPSAGPPIEAPTFDDLAAAPVTETVPWAPRFDPGDDLDGLLLADSPLLGRAFGNVRAR